MKEIISRNTYKVVKRMNRTDMDTWLSRYALAVYNDACRDAAVAEITALRDEFGYGTSRIARFMKRRDEIIAAINERLVSVDEAIDVLRREDNLRIRTDFHPEEVREVPNEVDV